NRYRIALELQKHEDENVRRRVENIPVRHYMNELTFEEEYDILEGDNLFRRHLTSEQRKERLKKRILRKYKDELVQDNRGGDRKSESLKIPSNDLEEEKSKDDPHLLMEAEGQKQEVFSSDKEQTGGLSELGLFQGEVGTLEEQAQEKEGVEQGSKQESESSLVGSYSEKSNYEGHSLIEKPKELAKKISEEERIPLGTARNYVSELKKELKTKEPKSIAKKEKDESKIKTLKSKDKVKEFQKKYSKMSSDQKKAEVNRLVSKLVILRKKRKRLDEEMMNLLKEDSEIVEKLVSVGEKKKVQGLSV
uniref:hypothetical protein n=1 Tax=Leptospira interrogans TaxID=173 RepID=UPI0007734720